MVLGTFASDGDCGRRPFVVAHRAGNCIAELRAAESIGALVEADVRLHRGRLEVRHPCAVGPLPVLRDGWRLEAGWRARLTLSQLLDETAPSTELMLDLKGRDGRVAGEVLRTIGPYLGERRFTVCARRWGLLEPFVGQPVRRLHSIGTARELRRFLDHFAAARLDGVSIHERLLHAHSIDSLRAIAGVVLTWPVNGPGRARELLRLGVDGLITDHAAVLSGPDVLGATS